MSGDRPLHLAVATRAAAPQHGYGGLERAVTHHLTSLAARGVRLTVFTQPPDPQFPPSVQAAGLISWQTVPFRPRQLPLRHNGIPDRLLHYPAFARALGRAISNWHRTDPFDLVHAHGLAGLGYAERLAAGQDLPPLILNPHGVEEFSRRNRWKWLAYAPFRHGLRQTARQAARVIATDQALCQPLATLLTLPTARIALLPNGVQPAELDALVTPDQVQHLTSQYQLAASPLILISVARLEQNKGLHDGISALSLLRDQLPVGWRWLIVGQGKEQQALQRQIAAAGLQMAIQLVGALPDPAVQCLFQLADLALIPSLYEGSSLVALEAMTQRLPVLATAVGGLPDKVLPGRTGWLTPPGDPAALAATLHTALAARANWSTLGAAGRELVETAFAWPALAAQYETLYRSLLSAT